MTTKPFIRAPGVIDGSVQFARALTFLTGDRRLLTSTNSGSSLYDHSPQGALSGRVASPLGTTNYVPERLRLQGAWLVHGQLAGTTAPQFRVLELVGGSFVERAANLTNIVNRIGADAAWTPDASHIALAGDPAVTRARVYRRDGTSFVDLGNVDAANTATGLGIDFSPDGALLAYSFSATPFLKLWSRSGDTFTPISAPGTMPVGGGRVRFSRDATHLAHLRTAAGTTKRLDVWSVSGQVFTSIAIDESQLPSATYSDLAISSDGKYIVLTSSVAPFIHFLAKDGANGYVSLPTPTGLALTTVCRQIDFTDDSSIVAVALSEAPNVATFVNPDFASELRFPRFSVSGEADQSGVDVTIEDDIAFTPRFGFSAVGGAYTPEPAYAPPVFVGPTFVHIDPLGVSALEEPAPQHLYGSARFPSFRASGDILVPFRGSAAALFPTLRAAGTITVPFGGRGEFSFPRPLAVAIETEQSENPGFKAFRVSGEVNVPIGGLVEVSFPRLAIEGEIVMPVAVLADLAFPKIRVAAVAERGLIRASGTLGFARLAVEGETDSPLAVVGDARLPRPTTDGSVNVPTAVLGAPRFPRFTTDGEVDVPLGGFVVASFPRLQALAYGGPPYEATGALRFPRLRVLADVREPPKIDALVRFPRFLVSGQVGMPTAAIGEFAFPRFAAALVVRPYYVLGGEIGFTMLRTRVLVRYGNDPLGAGGGGARIGNFEVNSNLGSGGISFGRAMYVRV